LGTATGQIALYKPNGIGWTAVKISANFAAAHSNVTEIGICQLSDTVFVITYKGTSGDSNGYYKVWIFDGTTDGFTSDTTAIGSANTGYQVKLIPYPPIANCFIHFKDYTWTAASHIQAQFIRIRTAPTIGGSLVMDRSSVLSYCCGSRLEYAKVKKLADHSYVVIHKDTVLDASDDNLIIKTMEANNLGASCPTLRGVHSFDLPEFSGVAGDYSAKSSPGASFTEFSGGRLIASYIKIGGTTGTYIHIMRKTAISNGIAASGASVGSKMKVRAW
jgi:hypothetical protein